MAIAKPLEKLENFQQLSKEIRDIIDQHGFEKNQIILQGLESGKDEWHIGVGAIEELEEQDEKKYCYLNRSLENTAIGSIIKKYKAYRARIMLMSPRRCYSVHKDPTPRIHIPIVTNDQCWMIWPTQQFCMKLKPEFLYWTNTTKEHTFLNGGTEDRIHIVMCVDSKILGDERVNS